MQRTLGACAPGGGVPIPPTPWWRALWCGSHPCGGGVPIPPRPQGRAVARGCFGGPRAYVYMCMGPVHCMCMKKNGVAGVEAR